MLLYDGQFVLESQVGMTFSPQPSWFHFEGRSRYQKECLSAKDLLDLHANAREIMSRLVELTSAATNAAKASTEAMLRLEPSSSPSKSNFGEASKVLKQPDTLLTDDPVQLMLWREQFLNCMVDLQRPQVRQLDRRESTWWRR